MADNTYKEKSKLDWYRDDGQQPSVDQLQFGALQRIADATEKMAENYNKLLRDVKYYKERAEQNSSACQRLVRSNAALRGVITKLKKEAGNG